MQTIHIPFAHHLGALHFMDAFVRFDLAIMALMFLFVPLAAGKMCFTEYREFQRGTAYPDTPYMIGFILLATIAFEVLGLSFATQMI